MSVVPFVQSKVIDMTTINDGRVLLWPMRTPEIRASEIPGFFRFGQADLRMLSQSIEQPAGAALGRANAYEIDLERRGQVVPPGRCRDKIFEDSSRARV
jgi:hypothetical protein